MDGLILLRQNNFILAVNFFYVANRSSVNFMAKF